MSRSENHLRAEIARVVHGQRDEIRRRRAGIPTVSTDALLERTVNNIDGMLKADKMIAASSTI
jgi:hypothetical protein